MMLYHGSNVAIERIDLAKSRPYKDFGRAFYLSSSEEQAREMARFKTLTFGGEEVVTAFEVEDYSMYNVLSFGGYTEEWAEFVYRNRDERRPFQHPYDVVFGPIANDTVGVQIRDLRERKISMARFLENLKYHKGITFQYAFCTDRAVSKLTRV